VLPLLILVPLIGILILNLPLGSFFRRLAFWFALAICLAQAGLVIFQPSFFLLQRPFPFSSSFSFPLAADSLSLVLLLSISLVAFAALMVGRATMEDATRRFDFVNVLILSVAGMNGIVLVTDLFSLYVFLEITAVSSFILIAFHKDKDALEGAFKYLILSAVATILMLASIALLLLVTGDTTFAGVAAGLKASPVNLYSAIAISLFAGGLLIKGGLVPFHGWLPDAYSSAPASVSVFLAGIVTKTTGVYTIIRLVTSVFGFTPQIQTILLVAGTVSIVFGALAALGQKDFKRMLAYSSISQVGYIIVSLGTGTPLGIAGAVFHLFNHAIFKSQLFINSAAVEEETRTRNMDSMGGLATRMPVTGATSVVGFLSTAGIPPLSGFWSKLIIIIALWTAGYYVYATIAVLASILTVAYFLSMQRRVFFGKLAQGMEGIKEAKAGIIIPALILTLITIGVGIFFPLILDTFILPVKSILG
jgi:multicomponent Na+:H+ antiporter subunit D